MNEDHAGRGSTRLAAASTTRSSRQARAARLTPQDLQLVTKDKDLNVF